MYIVPLQNPYSEALPTQAKRKTQFSEGGGIENRHRLWGGCLRSIGRPFKVVGQTTEKNGSALSPCGRMGPPNYREQRTAVYDSLHKKRGRQGSRK